MLIFTPLIKADSCIKKKLILKCWMLLLIA